MGLARNIGYVFRLGHPAHHANLKTDFLHQGTERVELLSEGYPTRRLLYPDQSVQHVP